MSKGHGIKYGTHLDHPYLNLHRKPNMHRLIFDHLDTLFPPPPSILDPAREWAQAQKDAHPDWITPLVDIAATEGKLGRNVSEITRPASRSYGFNGKELGVNSMVNGAVGGTGSGYFGYCFGEHIPEDVDLIVIELGEVFRLVIGKMVRRRYGVAWRDDER